MGMAASQARFLSLTARKSNVEYEGQQINQQRTSLANESSNLYAELTNLDVPTPPSASDYYTNVYTFTASEISSEASNTSYTLEDLYSNPDGDFASLSHTEIDYEAANTTVPTYTIVSSQDDDGNTVYSVNMGDASYEVQYDSKSDLPYTAELLSGVYGEDAESVDTMPYFEYGGTKYYLSNDLSDAATDGTAQKSAMAVKEVEKTVTEEFALSSYETNDVGRTTSLTIPVETDGKTVYYTYDLDCTTAQDQDAYDQAMLDYEYEQYVYEKNVSDLNAETATIQEKDKILELELTQLDTEQNALSTEMDSVTKVVEDNIESTFKTFG